MGRGENDEWKRCLAQTKANTEAQERYRQENNIICDLNYIYEGTNIDELLAIVRKRVIFSFHAMCTSFCKI